MSKDNIKICAYVQQKYAKQNYKNECLDTRKFIGLRVVVDCLERAGYTVDYAGIATVHKYNIVLVSLTSDCDWWPYITERLKWQDGDYKVLIGGAGVLHVSPFLPWFYAAMFGRGENTIIPLVNGIASGNRYIHESIAYSDTFSENDIYRVAQVDVCYQHPIKLAEGKEFVETTMGCNHKCLFCGYTWQRKFVSPYKTYQINSDLFGEIADKERAMLDWWKNKDSVDFSKLQTTAIDGFSERIRKGINKKITKEIISQFLSSMLEREKPHKLKFYNICGYPTETEDDWMEFLEMLKVADKNSDSLISEKQWGIILHCTPFRPMPATPMACAPASFKNYRGQFGKVLGKGLKGGLIYKGKHIWSVESMGTDSLSSVMLSMIAHRGKRSDCENIAKLCANKKFWSASSKIKEATLSKYFDMSYLFGAFAPDTLPSRYLRTYCGIEKMWGRTPLEIEYANQVKRNGETKEGN